MDSTTLISMLALTVGVLGHIISTVWWAAKITTILGALQTTIADIALEVRAARHTYVTKEDVSRAFGIAEKEKDSMWDRIDSLRDDFSELRESVAKNNNNKE